VEAFEHTIEVVFTAQEILVGNADYPTERSPRTAAASASSASATRTSGALLMAPRPSVRLGWGSPRGPERSLAHDRPRVRDERPGPRAAWGPSLATPTTADPMLNVLRMHRAETAKINEELVPPTCSGAAQRAWDEAVEVGEAYGVRNSQATVLAPTGTIGLNVDCDTTGIEPTSHSPKPRSSSVAARCSSSTRRCPAPSPSLAIQTDSSPGSRSTSRSTKPSWRPGAQGRAPSGLCVLDGRQHHPLHGPHQDDGGRAAVHQRGDLEDRERARRHHPPPPKPVSEKGGGEEFSKPQGL